MKIAFFDCPSGISGDMTLGALIDAGADLAGVQAGIDSLGLPSCRLVAAEVKRHGFRATHVTVQYEPEHKHRHLHHITDMIDRGQLSARARDLAKRIFSRLGEAEAKVHGTTVQKVHFHEVGAVDSIADIVGSAIALDLLGIERASASPVPTGTGTIEIAHGTVSIPAPATAELLTGIPLAASTVSAELTTPTGAAILASVASEFGPLPAMCIERIGYGAGTRDLAEQPNILRVLLGRQEADGDIDQVYVVETNLDDASGELVGYAATRLWEAGALDVYTTPIQMKKGRPGIILSALCRPADLERVRGVFLAETTTLGVRQWPVTRHKLKRQVETVQTAWGPVEGKVAVFRTDERRFSPEFEACRRLAQQHGVPLQRVYEDALRAFQPATAVSAEPRQSLPAEPG